MKKFVVLSVAFAIAIFAAASMPSTTSARSKKLIHSENPIPGRYIVILDGSLENPWQTNWQTEAQAYELAGSYGGSVDKVFHTAVKGFSAELTPEAAELLASDKRVLYVEEDSEVFPSVAAQSAADWGLDRIDQRNLPLNASYVYGNNGAGVNVYVIDSGILPTHVDFGGRASVALDVLNDGRNGIDCTGHGTHVAGTIGSSTYGVAKGANIFGIRVLPCAGSGWVSDLIFAIDWVTANRVNPAVVNISINASGNSVGMNLAINNSIASGVTYAVSAGNNNFDACQISPSNIPAALTVGATTASDNRAGYSNFGSCVDIWAPGHNITSLGHSSDTAVRLMSGTSMASPMVAGVAALYLQANPTASPATVANAIKSSGSPVVTNIDASSTNRLLYSWLGAAPPAAGLVTIIKEVRTLTDGTSTDVGFPFAAANLAASSFELLGTGEPPVDRFVDNSVYSFGASGMITVTQEHVHGWATTAITCVEQSGQGMPNQNNTTVDLANRKANIIVEEGEQVTCTFRSEELAPTSAPVSIGGRVIDHHGSGIRQILVSITNIDTGVSQTTMTNNFGFYRFQNMPSANFYVVSAEGWKRYWFWPENRAFTAEDDLVNVDFIGTPHNR
jgi:subtilisin family serine protease